MMILQVLLEGLGLGVLLVLVCAFGIRKGAVGMAFCRWSAPSWSTSAKRPAKSQCSTYGVSISATCWRVFPTLRQ